MSGSRAFVLDSYALLAYLNEENGGSRVAEIIRGAIVDEHHLLLSLINFGEILYRVERRLGGKPAQRVIQFIGRLPIRLADVDQERTMSAAHVKAGHPMSYADAFVVALALRTGGRIVTGDPEFRLVEHLVRIEWLPANRQARCREPEASLNVEWRHRAAASWGRFGPRTGRVAAYMRAHEAGR